jgi:hypothetical protein
VSQYWIAAGIYMAALAAGCGKTIDEPVDPNKASAALQAALDAWKAGEEYGTLQHRTPPVYFNEREWEAGKKLLDYQIAKADLMGRQGRCSARLSLRDKAGKVTEREISYLIDTSPRVVITREGLGP